MACCIGSPQIAPNSGTNRHQNRHRATRRISAKLFFSVSQNISYETATSISNLLLDDVTNFCRGRTCHLSPVPVLSPVLEFPRAGVSAPNFHSEMVIRLSNESVINSNAKCASCSPTSTGLVFCSRDRCSRLRGCCVGDC